MLLECLESAPWVKEFAESTPEESTMWAWNNFYRGIFRDDRASGRQDRITKGRHDRTGAVVYQRALVYYRSSRHAGRSV